MERSGVSKHAGVFIWCVVGGGLKNTRESLQGHHRQLQKQQHVHKEREMIDSMEHSFTEGVPAALPLRCLKVMAAKKAVALHTTNAFLSHRST
jgi:hypothetical protein